jgi:hypothetical protein
VRLAQECQEWDAEVGDERRPSFCVCGQAALRREPEVGFRNLGGLVARTALRECADRVTHPGKGREVGGRRRLRRDRDLVIDEVADRVGGRLQVIVVGITVMRSREPMPARAVARVRDPDDVRDRAPAGDRDARRLARPDVAQRVTSLG